MRDARSLLVELGTEELPPKSLDVLAAAFARGICDGLDKRGIAADLGHARIYCSPRRLAVWVPAVAATQPQQAIERRGPAISAGRDADGAPSKALSGFAQSCGVEIEALQTLENDKGAWFVHRAMQPGQDTAALLLEILDEALKGLPIPRPMRWGDHDYSFVRPAHWLVVLHGADIVDCAALGVASGRQSHGHRFHHPQPLHIADADGWLDALRAAHVLADPDERRARIRAEVERAAAGTGGVARLSGDLLDEIANLTEWPSAVACTFDREFLAVPREALITAMETQQKFVPVFAADGTLGEHFIGVANIDSKQPAEVRKGYERVLRPRFADARFFWDEDLKTPLADYQQALKSVTYQQALGSVWDKCMRVAELARITANRVGVDAALAAHAASLCKCDLLTRMVGEFPELQGVMGRYYASAHGEPAELADALDDFYRPRYAGDAIAVGKVGQVLAVAERIDTLAGIFAVGQKPSGTRDPFALRRAALGLARTLIEGGLDIDLRSTFLEALELLPESAWSATSKAARKQPASPDPVAPTQDGARRRRADEVGATDLGTRRTLLAAELHAFVLDRLRGYYADQGFAMDVFEAVLAVDPPSLPDFDRRLRAVAAFAGLPEAASLAAANKRVGNLLRKQDGADAGHVAIDPRLFDSLAEQALADALAAASQDSERQVRAGDYAGALRRLAALQAPVDRFFDEVLVMAENAAVRDNRRALLAELQSRFLAIADISKL